MNDEIKEKIERVRQGLPPKPSKTKKISGFLIIINLIVILAMVTIYKKTPTRNYTTTTLEYDRINYNIVIAKNIKTGRHILTIALNSLAPGELTALYHSSIMQITFQSEGQFIYGTEIGRNETRQTFRPFEKRVFETMMDDAKIIDFIDNHPQSLIPRRKSNLIGDPQHLPLTAVIKINTEKPVTLIVELKYETE